MTELTKAQCKEVIKRFERRDDRRDAPGAIAYIMGLDPDAVKDHINDYLTRTYGKNRPRVTHKITKQTRHGLRLVKVSSPAGDMDWYTDKSDKEIDKQIKRMEQRFKEGSS